MHTSVKAVLLIVIVAVGAGFFYLQRRGESSEKTRPLVLYGNVDIRQVSLGFQTGGRIQEMHFEEGDSVSKGQVLGTLDKGFLEDNLSLYRAQARVAEAALAKLEAGTRPQEIEMAQTMVEERQITVAHLQQVLQRQKELKSSGAVSRQSFDDVQSQYDAATARLAVARESLELAQEGPRVEDVAIARAEVEAARAGVDLAKRKLSDAELKAPSDGVILSRIQEPGAIVATGSPVFTLSLLSPVWVRAYITEPNLGRIHPGLQVEVYTDSKPGQPYQGQIGFISPVAEFTPKSVETEALRTDLVYRLRVVIKNPDQALRQGMPVTVRIPDA